MKTSGIIYYSLLAITVATLVKIAVKNVVKDYKNL